MGFGKYSFHTQSWRSLLRIRKPEALTRVSFPYKDLVKEGVGSPMVKNKALGHHTPDGEHLCLGMFQEVGLLFPDVNFGQIQSQGIQVCPIYCPLGL